jgi:hypothetical protein
VDGSYGGGNGVFKEEQDLGVNRTSKRKETYRLQVSMQKEGNSIRKERGKIQGTISSKRIFTKTLTTMRLFWLWRFVEIERQENCGCFRKITLGR